MGYQLPSLSMTGWIDEPAERADRAMSYYFASDYSQTEIFAGKVVTLQWQLEEYSQDTNRLNQEMTSYLTEYFNRYFDSATVEIDISEITDDEERLDIELRCTLVEKGKTYSLGRLIQSVNSKVVKILTLNN